MNKLRVREAKMISDYFEADDDDGTVVRARTPQDERAETERRRAARIALDAELAAEREA